ncbi:cytochrome P450 [Apiospora marii]|uniref:cytochrome P450 n=1 Tax=Apiospora marii TaxID=335849 RepID=UPI003131343A
MPSSPSLLSLETLGASVLSGGVLLRLLGAWLGYRLLLALYNVSPFHPLHKFPGPRLAAATFIYEFWFDFVRHGRYVNEIRKMHEIYGPIVRINPEELHCLDSSFVNEIYPGGGRIRDKHRHYLNANVGPVAVTAFGSEAHEQHRMRRGALNRFFSKAQMTKLEPRVQRLVQQLCDKLLAWRGGPIDLTSAYNCLTGDTISQYAFGQPRGFLAHDGWDYNYKGALGGFTTHVYFWRFFPQLGGLVSLAPYFLDYMPETFAMLMRELYITIPGHVRQAMRDPKAGTVFTDLLDAPDLPPEEKTVYRLAADGFSLTGAGTETTANVLTGATYFLLRHPAKRARLEQELARAGVDPAGRDLSWARLEQIPYLYGVVHETLRMCHGLSTRLARVARTEDLVYRSQEGFGWGRDGAFEYVVPRGTPIGMSAGLTHRDASVFPEPEAFRPERWITAEGERNTGLERYLLSFSKGSRICLGMNLAMCELYLTVAAVVLRVAPRMRLVSGNDDCVTMDHEVMIPKPKKGTKPITVVISPE